MDWISQLYHSLPTIEEIIRWGGLLALNAIVFTETGLLLGFFLPGDSLLFTAGLFAAAGDLHYLLLCTTLSLSAIIGDSTGYAIGLRAGHALFKREDSFFFKKKHLIATKHFYDKYGPITIVLARFMPFARTFAPVIAGVVEMKYSLFLRYNVIGGIAWVWGMCSAGYFLGKTFPAITDHLHLVIALIVFLSVLPGIIKYLQVKIAARKDALSVATKFREGDATKH